MKSFLTLLVAIASTACPAFADSEIAIRISYKVVLNPANGARPTGVTDAAIDGAIAEMNGFLRSYGRGYVFQRIDPVTDVGGVGGNSRPSPSHFFGIDMLAQDGTREQMESDALANPTLYAWNFSAVNVYINQANGGGQCAFPGHQLIAVGAGSAGAGWLQLHELGHYFDLCHTQGCPCSCCTPGQTGECHTTPGDDGISDTLPDLACWDRDEIAMHSFSVFFTQLTQSLRESVDDSFLNIMSYHRSSCGQGAPVDRLTERQLDRWSDTARTTRAAVCSGRTLQVISTATNTSSDGSSSLPYRTIPTALSASTSGDILLIRGNFLGPITISQPVTLRTSRGNFARLGS